MNRSPDDLTRSTIDRPVGWLIALGGCIVILDQTVFRLSELGSWASWWNGGAFAVVFGIVVLAVAGLVLPTRVLVVAWWTLPILYASLQATWVFGYQGSDLDTAVPWLWTVEPFIVTTVLLVVRPVMAMTASLFISSIPALSSLVIMGSILPAIARETPNQLGNIVYVVIFVGVCLRLRGLRTLEREVHSQQRRQIRAAALAQQHAKLSLFVHDEVLSVLSAAMQTTGPPPEVLRRAAGRATLALDRSAQGDEATGEAIHVREAAAIIGGNLREIDDEVAMETYLSGGMLGRDVVTAISLAAAEALRNSKRHAGEHAVRRVRLALSAERVRVVVNDDGVGFEPATPPSRLGITESIHRRMAELGGSSTVRSQPGRGTEVTLSWPT